MASDALHHARLAAVEVCTCTVMHYLHTEVAHIHVQWNLSNQDDLYIKDAFFLPQIPFLCGLLYIPLKYGLLTNQDTFFLSQGCPD